MSRGPGRWQRALLAATGGVHTATVSGVVRTRVPEPDRSDFTAARRAAKTLALEQRLIALYVYACQRCGHVQDHEPERCCGVVRSSLAVTRRGRVLPYRAPPPSGGACPRWIGMSVASPPGQLAVPDIDDLARLVLRRCYEDLESGRAAVQLRNAAALVRLAREIEQDRTAAQLDRARAELAMGEEAFRTILWTTREHFYSVEDQRRWQGFMDDLRAKLERVLGPYATKLAC